MRNHVFAPSAGAATARPPVMTRALRLAGVCILAGVLSACAQPKPLYSWQSYQPAVYAYLQDDGEDHAVQAQAMEGNIETARASDQALPPGFRAHLGMLYLKMGNGNRAVEQWQGEKQAFPESAPFMDFLLRNTASASSADPGASTPSARPSRSATPTRQ